MKKHDPFVYRRNCEVHDDMNVPQGMKRIALQVEYNGASFHGFQRQTSTSKTVQFALERALSKVASEPITLVCSGRTDAGVHATSQIVHFDTLACRPEKAWIKGGNSHLPFDVRILKSVDIGLNFHARFSALSRSYCYVMHASMIKSTHLNTLATWVKLYEISNGLDIKKMMAAADKLKGEHDFGAFQASGCQAHTSIREIKAISLTQKGEMIILHITANAFLQHMVRNIVGFLLSVAKGKLEPDYADFLLEKHDRTLAPETADSDGLYFVNVDYPSKFDLPFKGRDPLIL